MAEYSCNHDMKLSQDNTGQECTAHEYRRNSRFIAPADFYSDGDTSTELVEYTCVRCGKSETRQEWR